MSSTTVKAVPSSTPALAPVLAFGKVTSAKDGKVCFAPAGTSYDLHLVAPNYSGPIGKPVYGVVRVMARKVWTVPSGGNFVVPIIGPCRIIQGRVKALSASAMVVHAGTDFFIELPDSDMVYDLANGPILVGRMVNVTGMPGAAFEWAG